MTIAQTAPDADLAEIDRLRRLAAAQALDAASQREEPRPPDRDAAPDPRALRRNAGGGGRGRAAARRGRGRDRPAASGSRGASCSRTRASPARTASGSPPACSTATPATASSTRRACLLLGGRQLEICTIAPGDDEKGASASRARDDLAGAAGTARLGGGGGRPAQFAARQRRRLRTQRAARRVLRARPARARGRRRHARHRHLGVRLPGDARALWTGARPRVDPALRAGAQGLALGFLARAPSRASRSPARRRTRSSTSSPRAQEPPSPVDSPARCRPAAVDRTRVPAPRSEQRNAPAGREAGAAGARDRARSRAAARRRRRAGARFRRVRGWSRAALAAPAALPRRRRRDRVPRRRRRRGDASRPCSRCSRSPCAPRSCSRSTPRADEVVESALAQLEPAQVLSQPVPAALLRYAVGRALSSRDTRPRCALAAAPRPGAARRLRPRSGRCSSR